MFRKFLLFSSNIQHEKVIFKDAHIQKKFKQISCTECNSRDDQKLNSFAKNLFFLGSDKISIDRQMHKLFINIL